MRDLVLSGCLALLVVAGCARPNGGCTQNATGITSSTVTFAAGCGGDGDHAAGSVVTPAPVVVPPVVVTPVVTPTEGGAS